MNDFDYYLNFIQHNALSKWQQDLTDQLNANWYQSNDGNIPKFKALLEQLPSVKTQHVVLNQDWIEIGKPEELSEAESEQLYQVLSGLKPWRKGPFKFFGIEIDAEWRCDRKWQRVAPALQPLRNRRVLDVGSGNGYYALRMLGQVPETVTAIDPSPLSVIQFLVIQHFIGLDNIATLPLAMEDLLPNLACWDTVFSMGVLYHRKSPFDHLAELKGALKPGGQLILETLTIDGDENAVLVPLGRYAIMNNVYFLPSPDALSLWLRKAGFENIQLVDLSTTSTEEQRQTEWKPGTSLEDYLDPKDSSKTVEGHPAPKRVVLSAIKPESDKRLPRYHLNSK